MTTPSALEARLAALSPDKRALVMRRLGARARAGNAGNAAGAGPAIPRVPRDGPIPLSFAQRRLWFLQELEGPSATYNVAVALRLTGPLRRFALEAALGAIVRRHEALRTNLARTPDGGIEQRIAPADDAPATAIALERLDHLDPAAAEAEARRRATAEARQPFDLERDPLLRVRLLQTGAEAHLLVLVVHHIVADAWSMGVLVRELGALYRAFAAGAPTPLPDLPIQYADYAAWERAALDDAALGATIDAWREALAGAPPALEIFPDRPRPPVVTSRGSSVRFEVESRVVARLRALAEAEGASLFVGALAALDVLLTRYAGQDDVVVGCPFANRRHRETEGLIGFFVNTLPIRVDLSGAPSFREVLRRVRRAAAAAIERQEAPFERLVDELAPDRDMSRPPIFQVVLAYQNAGEVSLDLPGLGIVPVELDTGTAKFELTFVLEEAPAGWRGTIEYNRDLYDEPTVARMADHLRALLAAAVAEPDRPVADLEILSPHERRTLLGDWSGVRTHYPRDAAVPRLFEEVAARAPEAVALVLGDRTLTYGELNRRANRLAHHLRARGVGRGTMVGVSADRSFEMVVALLGILKAGGAYVPLDSAYPAERLAFMVRDTRVALVLAHGRPPAGLPPGISLVDVAEATREGSDEDPPPETAAEDVAYVMYTSGSTGEPKGSRIPHRAIVRLVRGTDFVSLDETETFLQLAPISFDASTLEIWGALLGGGRLALAPPHQPSLPEIGDLIRRHGVTTLWLTSSLFHLMVDERLEDLAPLRQLLAGGDVLSVPHVLRAAKALTNGRVINGYGPTENTTFTCCHTVDPDRAYRFSIPIGRPIANTRVHVLDRRLHPVPVGVAGELYAGGDGLALDYLNRPDLTAERFVPNPFGEGRLYRTGDLVRWLPDGVIEFLGRRDDQVKIRGFRVEPGEVEAALVRREEVREAVVVTCEAAPGRREIVAYVVPAAGAAVEDPGFAGRLREALRAALPDFMVPSAIVCLGAMPLTPNGKVDRRALPTPDRTAGAETYLAPRTKTETDVADVFCEVLGVPAAGVRDRFFDLGGNSLLATQLVSRLRRRVGVDVPLRRVFETPDVEGLARAIDAATGGPGGAGGAAAGDIRPCRQCGEVARISSRPLGAAEPIPRVDRDAPLPLSFAQERLWFLHRLEPDNPFYNVAVALSIEGALDIVALERTLEEIARRHEILRTTYHEADGRPVQRIHDALRLPLGRIDLRGATSLDAEIERLAREEARRPFDLETGPVVRATLLAAGAERHVLLVTIHHVAADGWSMGVLVNELTDLFLAHAAGRAAPRPELAVQYADFAAWQRRWMEREVYARQSAYWKRQLDGAPAELTLPADRPRPPAQSFRGGSVRFEVDAETTRQLRRVSRESDATLFMTLLAAFATLLSRYAAQDDLVIGSPIANRTRTEVEPLIGFFVNTLALRLDLSGDPSFRELVRRSRRVAVDAYANQDLPFERLVDELQPERDLSRNPLFQVMFALQNAPVRRIELPGLRVAPLEYERTTAQFDVVLDMWETEQGLLGVLEFSADLFDHATVRRMVEHFRTLLAGAAAEPDRRLSALPLLTEAERRQLLDEFNGSRAVFPLDRTLHGLFETEVEAGPDRVAAEHGGERISYRALNARANRIAHRLLRLGVGRNDFAGILLERGIDFLAAMLGVLKAGGAYVPIDPSYPEERIAYMVSHSATQVLLSRHGLRDRSAGSAPANLRWLLLDEEDLSAEPEANPAPMNVATDRAYMLYTSGSTGLPKGAILRHDGKVNHVYGQFRWLRFHRDSTFLQSAPSSSDISVWQFLGPLLIGGRTVIVDYETLCDPAALWEEIRARGVTIIELVPVAMGALLEHVATRPSAEREATRLEWAMATGEAVSPALVNRWLELFPRVPIVNAYGPTEAADDVCQHVITTPLPPGARGVPIGTPLANLALYVLDPHLGLVPIGAPGEICVSGIGVGEGYWRDEARTRESFVANPYAGGGRGDVLYRTGDVGVWRPDGVLVCLARLDEQVKIRGFRIELGEIEAALGRHPAVRDAVVLARDDDQRGERRLAAYVVPNLAATEVAAEVRRARGEQVALWQDLHENDYRQTLDHGDPTFNVIGWDSSYDNQPLPVEEMREYADHTVARILGLGPRRVLEIGCGAGLIMFRLLPHLESYVGTDLSRVVIERLQALQGSPELRARIPGLDRAVLRQGRADDLGGIEPGSVDTVIFPSVVQYFPGVDYLLAVLDGALGVLRPDGAIFFGDVRSLPLLELFHASVQLAKADDGLEVGDLLERIRAQGMQEQELALDPAFFPALGRRYPAIRDVEILPKRGLRQNEMTRFRYDVVIRLGAAARGRAAVEWRPWEADHWTAEGIGERLAAARPAVLALRDAPNSRVAAEVALRRLLAGAHRPRTVGEIRAALRERPAPGLEPEDLSRLGAELGYDVHVSLARSGGEGRFDVAFLRHEGPGVPPVFPELDSPQRGVDSIRAADRLTAAEAWARYANNPLHERLARGLEPRLREYLKDRIPHYMVPGDLVMLDRLPTTPAGKVDRRALPAPRRGDLLPVEALVPPRTEIEKALVAIWCEVLGLERCGVRQSFFDLGGHSLKATQVVSRVHRRLGVELPLRTVFSHPTIEELAGRVAEAAHTRYRSIARVADAPHHPVSHAQRRLWVLSQLEEGSVAYNMPASILLEGPLDQGALTRAFDTVVGRHESLRTTFVVVDGEPRQRIHPDMRVPLRFVDLAPAPDGETAARDEALRDAATPFDLAAGPLVRLALLRLGSERHVLLFNVHHVVSDDWSIGVLVREVMRAYGGAPLPPLRIQYRDFARWQNDLLLTEAVGRHRAYWLDRFAGEVPVLDLPLDFPRPPVKTYRGRTVSLRWDAGETQALRDLARRHGTSLFMTLLAAVKALLYRYTGQTDLVVAAPVAGREHPELEDQIGFYINTLPLRDVLRPEAPFAEFLAEVTRNTTEAIEHQSYPVDRLVDELALRRDPSRMPLADVVVVMQNPGAPDLSLPGLAVRSFVDEYDASKYDLHFAFDERDGTLRASVVYNPDLFRRERIERMGGHLRTLLRSVRADESRRVERLEILPAEERRRLLVDFNPAPGRAAPARTLVGWFEEQAARTPDREAVSFPRSGDGAEPGRRMTYAELDAAANRLARRLVAMGVGPDVFVGLFAERSIEAVVGILGILKAGGAYVPIDAAYPRDRIAFMIEDARMPVLVTRQALALWLGEAGTAGPAVVFLDGIAESGEAAEGAAAGTEGAAAGTEGAPTGAGPDNVAYVIYTSGSTGRPKGVMVTHANATRLFSSTERWFGFDESDVWALFHSIAFDFSVWELWGALLHGGRVVIVPHEVARSPRAFWELLEREGVTVLNQTPSAFRALIAAEEREERERELALRYVVFGGEALDLQSLRPWFARHGDEMPRLVNMYGITETTVHVTYRPLSLADLEDRGSVIGAPIPDLKVHILDPCRQPVPVGVPGEIHVGGAGVARGYWDRAELTAERFVPDPFTGGRLYRSGDLGRYRDDGDIEYLGRIDHQVKIRGFRIELGEIEAALVAHDAVRQALVVARSHGPEQRLIAYVVADTASPAIPGALRRHVRERLPEYMVPAAIVPLTAFPLTPHGKIDVKALPDPDAVGLPAAEEDARPRTETETLVAEVMRELLGVERIPLRENFFDVGAQSLLLVRAHARLEERLGRKIPLVALYQHPTVQALAAFLVDGGGAEGAGEAVMAKAGERAARRRAGQRARRDAQADAPRGGGRG